MGYISVDNVDTHAGKVTAAGGAIFRPDIPNVGRFAVVGNPHGAGFVLFRPNASRGPWQILPPAFVARARHDPDPLDALLAHRKEEQRALDSEDI